MRDGENAPIVLVAAREEFLNKLRSALADAVGLLHAETHRDAISLLERLRTEISLAIAELEHFDGCDLIGELRRPPNPVKTIATTAVYPAPVLENVKDRVDAILPEAVPPEEWRKTVEAVLQHNKETPDGRESAIRRFPQDGLPRGA